MFDNVYNLYFVFVYGCRALLIGKRLWIRGNGEARKVCVQGNWLAIIVEQTLNDRESTKVLLFFVVFWTYRRTMKHTARLNGSGEARPPPVSPVSNIRSVGTVFCNAV